MHPPHHPIFVFLFLFRDGHAPLFADAAVAAFYCALDAYDPSLPCMPATVVLPHDPPTPQSRHPPTLHSAIHPHATDCSAMKHHHADTMKTNMPPWIIQCAIVQFRMMELFQYMIGLCLLNICHYQHNPMHSMKWKNHLDLVCCPIQ